MRLRLELPGRRRRAGLGGLTRRAAAAAVLATLAGCGGSAQPPPIDVPQVRAPALSPALQRLPLGLTEANPALLRDGGEVPAGFARGREVVDALRPGRVRVLLDWAAVQPDPAQPPNLALPRDGCVRAATPCAPYAGLREQLEALATRRPVPEVVVVVLGAPDWAARPAQGCERPEDGARSRPLAPGAREAYAALVRAVVALGEETGAPVRWWSPWNEPNHPAFVSPQRARCDPHARTLAPGTYAQIVRAAKLPQGVGLVLGEMAGYDEPTARTTAVGEFVEALPRDVACRDAVWAVHQFAGPRGTRSTRSDDAVRTLRDALRARDCTAGARVWVTETGAGAEDPGRARAGTAAELRASCRGFARVLRRWDRDPRVDGVFQYTAREDPLHPVGLLDVSLRRVYPAARLLAAWGRTGPGDPPPGPAACG